MKKRRIEIDAREIGGLEEALNHILGDILSDKLHDRKGKIPIGIISAELKKKYEDWRSEKEEFEYEINLYKDKLLRKYEREMAEKFEEKFYDSQREKDKLWKEIRKELNINDPEMELNIDTKTGVISQWVETHGSKH